VSIGKNLARGSPTPPLSTRYEGGLQDQRLGDWVPIVFWLIGPDLSTEVSPALFLRVNPDRMVLSYSKVVNTIETRGAHIEQYWGESLDQITIDSSTGPFVTTRKGLSCAVIPEGSTTPMRHVSISYSQYTDLVALYGNNGQVYGSDGSVVLSGRVRMAFDNSIYDGHFTNFNTQELATGPFMFTYSFTFKVEEVVVNMVPILSDNLR